MVVGCTAAAGIGGDDDIEVVFVQEVGGGCQNADVSLDPEEDSGIFSAGIESQVEECVAECGVSTAGKFCFVDDGRAFWD